MNARNWTDVHARWLRCRALAWGITGDVACEAALRAYSRSTEAAECAALVQGRADAVEAQP